MVGMGVGQCMRRNRPAAELAQDPLAGVTGSGVDEHVADQVDVDRERRKAVEHVHVICEVLQGAASLPIQKLAVAILREIVSVQPAWAPKRSLTASAAAAWS